jgi:hypothetical protein
MRNMPRRVLGPAEHRLIATLHVEGLSDAAIAGAVGEQVGERVERSTIRKARNRVGVQELIAAERKRAGATRRSQEYRERERAKAEADAPAVLHEKLTGHRPDTPTRMVITNKRHGDRVMFRDPENGQWYREGVCGRVPAKRSDWEGQKVPASFTALYGFGEPGYDRPPIGFIPPEDRKNIRVRRMQPGPYGDVEHLKSVSPAELEEATAEGWQRV